MKNSESLFKKKLLQKLNSLEYGYFFTKEALALRGFPDIIGCYKGRFIGLECKKDASGANKKTGRTPLQNHVLEKIRYNGGFGSFIYPENEEEVLQEIEVFVRQICPRE